MLAAMSELLGANLAMETTYKKANMTYLTTVQSETKG